MKIESKHFSWQPDFHEIFALFIVAVMAFLLYYSKVTQGEFLAVTGVVVGYYFSRTIKQSASKP